MFLSAGLLQAWQKDSTLIDEEKSIIIGGEVFDLMRYNSGKYYGIIGLKNVYCKFPLPLNDQKLSITLFRNTYFVSSRASFGGLNVNIKSESTGFMAEYERNLKRLTLFSDLEFIQTDEKKVAGFTVGAKILLINSLNTYYKFSSGINPIPLGVEANYFDESMKMNDPPKLMYFTHIFSTKHLATEYTFGYENSFSMPREMDRITGLSLSGFNREVFYRLKTDLKWIKLQLEYRFSRKKYQIIISERGLEFSNFNLSNYKRESVSVNGSFPIEDTWKVETEYQYNLFGAYLTGVVESWPFSSIIQSIFINRFYMRLQGSLKYHSLSFDVSNEFKTGKINIGLTYYDIIPDIVTETWQPEFLFLGIKHYKKYIPEIKRAGLISAKIGMIIRLSKHIVSDFAISQIIPVYLSKNRNTSSSGTIVNQQLPSEKISKVDGGRLFILRLFYNF